MSKRRTRTRRPDVSDDYHSMEEYVSTQHQYQRSIKNECTIDENGMELLQHEKEIIESDDELDVTCNNSDSIELPRNPRPSLCLCGEVFHDVDDGIYCDACAKLFDEL